MCQPTKWASFHDVPTTLEYAYSSKFRGKLPNYDFTSVKRVKDYNTHKIT